MRLIDFLLKALCNVHTAYTCIDREDDDGKAGGKMYTINSSTHFHTMSKIVLCVKVLIRFKSYKVLILNKSFGNRMYTLGK